MRFLLILLTILISSCTVPIACTEEAKMCPDGSFVARDHNNNCEFKECSKTITCDYTNNCPEGFNCYKFENEEPICFQGDPCLKCSSFDCDFTESFPMQVIC